MSFNRPTITGHSTSQRPGAGYGFVVADGADPPTSVGGMVKSAARLVTAGAVPFLRVTLYDPLNLDRAAIIPALRGDVYAKPQVTSLTATVGGAPDPIRQFDVVYFDETAAEIEPVADRLDLTIVCDLITK